MSSFLITFFAIVLVVLLMSVGVLFGRKPVQGSCGGLNECEICGGEPSKCEQRKAD